MQEQQEQEQPLVLVLECSYLKLQAEKMLISAILLFSVLDFDSAHHVVRTEIESLL